MTEIDNKKFILYENQIKSIISTIEYIFSLWDDIKNIDLNDIKFYWKGNDCDIFINKYLENELFFNKLKELLCDYQLLYSKIYEK